MIEEMRTIRTHLLATAACLLLCVGARAETLDVCPTGCTYASIQNAIDASSDGDTIAVAAGTYHEFDITLQGKAITISGDTDSNGLPAVTIDSQGMGTNIIGFFGEGNDTIIEHLVFTGCSGEGVAAVTMFHADPIMINCTFIDNVNTGLGGGAYNLNGSPHFIDCRFIDNNAHGEAATPAGKQASRTTRSSYAARSRAIRRRSAARSETSAAAQSSPSAFSGTTPPRNMAARSSTKATTAANAGSGM